MYELHIIFTLLGMITAGAGRIVAVKVYFQIQEEESQAVTPLFVTLLYLVGQALSLVVHYIYVSFKKPEDHADESKCQKDDTGKTSSTIEISGGSMDEEDEEGQDDVPTHRQVAIEKFELDRTADIEDPIEDDSTYELSREFHCEDNGSGSHQNTPCPEIYQERPRPKLKRQGSDTGLTERSKKAVVWVHRIPWYLKPMIPGFFNLCNSALRWTCLVYVAASTAEILISAMELVLSAFAARIIRKRDISNRRWFGISIVTVGILLVGFAKGVEKKEDQDEEQRRFLIGNLLIFGQCVFSVLQDLSEEIFMQETEFPATLLLGMEGLFGLVFGVPIYLLFFTEDIVMTRFNIAYVIGLVFLVLITGIFNIRTTEVTSSMTRNVWKQFRIMLVWVIALLVYYIGNNDMLGEPFVIPSSLYLLGGFSVILTGVYLYYIPAKTSNE